MTSKKKFKIFETINKEVAVNVNKHFARIELDNGEEHSIETFGSVIPFRSHDYLTYKGRDLFYSRIEKPNFMLTTETPSKHNKGGKVKVNSNYIKSIIEEGVDTHFFYFTEVTKKFLGFTYSQYYEYPEEQSYKHGSAQQVIKSDIQKKVEKRL